MTWLTVEEFTTQTGISTTASLVQTALDFSEKDIIRHIFISKELKTAAVTSEHRLGFFPMDTDGSGVVDTGDVDCYEFDSDDNYYDLNTSLTEVNSREQKTKFDINVPTNGREMTIEFKTGRERFDKMLIELKELEVIRAANWFYNKIPMEKLQQGVSSWNINGVSVSFDSTATKDVHDTNKIEIKSLMKQLRPKQGLGVKPGRHGKTTMFYSDRRSPRSFNVR